MPTFQTFTDVHTYLDDLMAATRLRTGAYTLERMKALMSFLGNPQDDYQVIHVAGTSGKTSTCYYLSALLHAGGKKTGLSVSPHTYEVNERIQIGTKPLSESVFCRELTRFVAKVKKSSVKPTYFELLVAFAFWEFSRQKVDYAVIEVGLGGLLDGTNVMSRRDKICVITDIGYDHVSTLGKTLAGITAQKAGIILPNNVVFSYDQGDEVMEVLREVCDQQQAELHEVQPVGQRKLLGHMPLFQRRNWHLALSVYDYLTGHHSLPRLTNEQLAETSRTYVPGRMELIRSGGKAIILDAAHNPQKFSMLARSMKHAHPKQPVACMVGLVRTKQAKVRENLEALLPGVSHLIITDFSLETSERLATDPKKIAEHCDRLGYKNWEVIPRPSEALRALLSRKEEVLLITGSLFLLNVIYPSIMELNDSSYSSD